MKIASIFKKVLMAITGLLLVGFLVSHLAGNLLIYAGADTFNGYASLLESKPLLVDAAEIGLLLIFLLHIFMALTLTGENSAARPASYEVRKTAGESTLASRTMWYTGLVVFLFVVLHVYHFKFGAKKDGETMVLWQLVTGEFHKPWVVGLYVAAMALLGLHISHGIGSMFQSLGLFSANRRRVRQIGALIGWILVIGFASLPLYSFLVLPAKEVKPAATEKSPQK